MSGAPRRIGLVVHTARTSARVAAARINENLAANGIEVVVADEGGEPDVLGLPVRDAGFAEDLDLVISLGGDGTFLRAAHRCRDARVPVLGVNLGRLGFLTEVDPDQLDRALGVVLAGQWTVTRRGTLQMQAVAPNGTVLGTGWALNEVSVEKSAREHMLFTEVSVGGNAYTRFGADAVIVATSTGSTAYALSAGGPIVSPELDVTLVVPVAPHTLYDRTLVADPDEHVRITVAPDQQAAIVSRDGRTPLEVPSGGHVDCTGSDVDVLVAEIEPIAFPELIRRKFNLT